MTANQNFYKRMQYRRRYRHGLCPRCNKPKESTTVCCEECKQSARNNAAARRMAQ